MLTPEIKDVINNTVKELDSQVWDLALAIHKLAEKPCEEVESSGLIAEFLKEQGFEVTFPYPNIPTAFRAEWGEGEPTIGMLGEYDALPNCGLQENTWGHGCGHNLLGTAPAFGAIAASRALKKSGSHGKIVYYGCPAEETLVGKVYMARDGAFRDLDACLCWHPAGRTLVRPYGGAAMDSILLDFHGKTAHAAGTPHLGRSALDGVILTDIAVNYLREHIPENVRIHSIIRHGGEAPNVVPGYASSWYFIRGKNRAEVDHVRERLLACARGAAEATGTTMKWQLLTAIYERLPNLAFHERLLEHLKDVGAPQPTEEDRKRVKEEVGLEPCFVTEVISDYEAPGRASSDEDSVSWLTPLARFNMACMVPTTTPHHRELTAQAAMPFAQKGLLHAAKVFAQAAVDVCQDKELLSRIRAEFAERTQGFTYDPLVPADQPVPKDMSPVP